jgi:hypothetical protein
MLDFSLRHLNFLLNEIHKGEIIGIVFILRKSPSSKKYVPDAQERFYFFCNNKDNDIKTRGSVDYSPVNYFEETLYRGFLSNFN